MHSTKIAHATEKKVLDFLVKTFEPNGPLYRSDMEAYATLAKFLSNDGEVAEAAAQLAGRLGGLLVNMSQHCPDGVSDPFLEALRTLGDFYGFNPTHCYTLNNQVPTEAFHWVVSQKSLFNDAFTRPHGEYTHSLQWLLMAFRFGSSLPIADLYARSVAYTPKAGKQFTGYKGQPSAEQIYLWNFLVDCFEGSDEDFRTNIRCDTYRCPQYFTKNLVELSPESWLGRFLIMLRNLGNKGGEPAPSPRYDKPRPQKGNISYTPQEIQENLDKRRWETTGHTNVYRVVPPRIPVH
jgi:Family of unknown function (DUF5636)